MNVEVVKWHCQGYAASLRMRGISRPTTTAAMVPAIAAQGWHAPVVAEQAAEAESNA